MKLPNELIEALDAHPDNVAGYLVAGDLLNSLGDPWGELISIAFQLTREGDPQRFLDFKKRTEGILSEQRSTWFGDQPLSVEFKYGFVESIRVADDDQLDAVLAHEVPRLTRKLEVLGPATFIERALVRLKQTPMPRLDTLSLYESGTRRQANTPREGRTLLLGEPATAAPLPPRLRQLNVDAVMLDWANIDNSRLEKLKASTFRDPALSRWLKTLRVDSLGHLELFDLDFDTGDLFDAVGRQKKVKLLRLEHDLPTELVGWLNRSPVLSSVQHLALGGPSTDDTLDELLKSFARYSRLKTLLLYGGQFGRSWKARAYKQLPQITFERYADPMWFKPPRK